MFQDVIKHKKEYTQVSVPDFNCSVPKATLWSWKVQGSEKVKVAFGVLPSTGRVTFCLTASSTSTHGSEQTDLRVSVQGRLHGCVGRDRRWWDHCHIYALHHVDHSYSRSAHLVICSLPQGGSEKQTLSVSWACGANDTTTSTRSAKAILTLRAWPKSFF